ncbi:MAG: MFS transporter [Bacteroidia bacterium]|nr:MFS transporter [Bacteroidia bacterium]
MPTASIFCLREFRNYFFGRFFLFLGIHTQMNTVSLQVYYQYTRDELMLGVTGLCEAIPFMASALYMGYLADSRNRKNLISLGLCGLILLMMIFVWISLLFDKSKEGLLWLFGSVCIFGLIRALLAASLQSLLPAIIGAEWYEKAAAWNSSAWQISTIAGSLISTYAFLSGVNEYHPERAYLCVGLFYAVSLLFFKILPYRHKSPVPRSDKSAWGEMADGVKFVLQKKMIFGALLMDMLAVLFGGVTAIIPAFVDKALGLEPDAVAYLRMAPALGALAMALFQTRFSVLENAGKFLIYSVTAFGIFTMGFAWSPDVWWAFLFLFLTGAADNISIVIRHTLIQLITPDNMRGKVSAINSIFIGSSNEIGAFESGLAARLMGIRPSVYFGGFMTIASVLIVSVTFKGLNSFNLKKWLKDSE